MSSNLAATASDTTALENPIWQALTTGHRSIALANGLARRYESRVSPLVGLRVPTAAAFSDLRLLVARGERVALFTTEPLQVPDDWNVIRTRLIEQMTCDERPAPALPQGLLTLRERDVPEMLALAEATQPGPFLPRTFEMGRYLGIRAPDGRLVAMAGERLRLAGATEISAVCTDPGFQGRGYARALVLALADRAFAQGRPPFLHVKSENGAKRVYEKLGFGVSRIIQLTNIAPR